MGFWGIGSEELFEAVFSLPVSVVWLPRPPKLDFPRSAVGPLPHALLFDVVTSDPGPVEAFAFQAFQNKSLDGTSVDCGQMASFFATKVLSCSPPFLLGPPEVAMSSVLLPA